MQRIFSIRMLLAIPAAFATGFIIEYAFAHLVNRSALSLIVSTIAVYLCMIGVLLALLPAESKTQGPWIISGAWLQSLLLCGAAFAGVAMAPVHHESWRTFFAMWALFAAHAAVITGIFGLLATLFFPSVRPARQCVLLCVGVMATALFWSRGLIEMTAQSPSEADAPHAAQMADAVVKLSPPVTVAEAWHQECDAARKQTQSGSRFDIIHGPLTYNVWLGSFQMVAYPDLYPARGGEGFNPGLLLAMLAWALPVVALCEVLGKRRNAKT
jgi:hypothetical protein